MAAQTTAQRSGGRGKRNIYVTSSSDGSGTTRLTTTAAIDASPAWSPNGKKIAFMKLRTNNSDIFAVNTSTREQKRLTADPTFALQPDWQPLVN